MRLDRSVRPAQTEGTIMHTPPVRARRGPAYGVAAVATGIALSPRGGGARAREPLGSQRDTGRTRT